MRWICEGDHESLRWVGDRSPHESNMLAEVLGIYITIEFFRPPQVSVSGACNASLDFVLGTSATSRSVRLRRCPARFLSSFGSFLGIKVSVICSAFCLLFPIHTICSCLFIQCSVDLIPFFCFSSMISLFVPHGIPCTCNAGPIILFFFLLFFFPSLFLYGFLQTRAQVHLLGIFADCFSLILTCTLFSFLFP